MGLDRSSVTEENIQAVSRLQARAHRRRTLPQRLGDSIAVWAAQEATVGFHAVWFAVWIVVNTGHLGLKPFDSFPFPLLTTIVSLEAIFLTLFILASEHRLTQDAERRGQLDLQVNLLAEQEMTMVLRMLQEICERLELHGTIRSEKFLELVRRTDVSQLAEQIDQSVDGEPEASGSSAGGR